MENNQVVLSRQLRDTGQKHRWRRAAVLGDALQPNERYPISGWVKLDIGGLSGNSPHGCASGVRGVKWDALNTGI